MTRMKFVLSSLLLAALTAVALAQAGFVAQPYGDQNVNADGSVTLPQGGVLRDNRRGYSVDATFIQYKDNEYLRATNARLKNNTGQSINAKSLDFDIKADRMNIVGPLDFSDNNVSGLRASKAVAYVAGKKTVAFNVSAASPRVRADAAVFDNNRNEVFLYGNYEFVSKDGKQRGSGAGSSASVVINFTDADKPRITSSKAIPAPLLQTYVALVNQSR
jgi:hypothetical protein